MRLWLWGDNSDGGIGDGTVIDRSSPVQTITLGTTWKDANVGYGGVIALKEDGSLWTWGSSTDGVLGNLDDNNDVSSPVHIAQDKTWKSIGCADYYYGLSCAIDTNNKLYTWGYNGYGGLGLEDTNNRSSPVQVGTKDWLMASAGAYITGAIDTNKKLWIVGYNGDGQLGLNDTTDRSSMTQVGNDDWDMIAVGYLSVLGIKTDGTLWAWGFNNDGELGFGDTEPRSSPVQIGSASDWKLATISTYHAAAIKNDGSLYTWGYNSNGQLGLGDDTYTSSPIQVAGTWLDVNCGYYNTIGLKSDGTVWCWGANYNGQLGDNTIENRSSPVQIHASKTGWTSVSTGYLSLALNGEEPTVSKSCSNLSCSTPAFKCYVGVTESCACARWKFYTAQCTRIQQSLGICSGTSGAYVPAITVCNQKLF